ncbi:GntR family transcriptional regulator [Agrobacterium larrymoorei]|uniref:GntR family transcriptional regulator n=1 Tax=Agrobacterium larrymoorei TaxID=160699 RepID=UPI001572D268|nr:GntR family transcriptional regulator [Agrobacterium larrymoorei]NTJ41896.1 GntR family transcriptional regulator [Agrobacterium larrymoorei]
MKQAKLAKTNVAQSATGQETTLTLAEATAAGIRERVVSGVLPPGSHLSEVALCEELQISRNTLREVFRLLTKEGVLRHEANRGVFVSTPSISTIMDIYRVRRVIECPAIAGAHASHPSVKKMRAAVEDANAFRSAGEWLRVGSADIAFHLAIVELADSPRLSAFYAQVSLELRLVFGLLRDPEYLHGPFIEQNAAILAHLENGQPSEAARLLEDYLLRAERFILAAYSRVTKA